MPSALFRKSPGRAPQKRSDVDIPPKTPPLLLCGRKLAVQSPSSIVPASASTRSRCRPPCEKTLSSVLTLTPADAHIDFNETELAGFSITVCATASALWSVGTLTIDQVESEDTSPARDINFDPLVLPNGIAASDDPLLSARSAAYAQSFTRREGEHKDPSAVSTAEAGK